MVFVGAPGMPPSRGDSIVALAPTEAAEHQPEAASGRVDAVGILPMGNTLVSTGVGFTQKMGYIWDIYGIYIGYIYIYIGYIWDIYGGFHPKIMRCMWI